MKIQLGDVDITNDLVRNKRLRINWTTNANTYVFDKVEWGIVENAVDSATALNNKNQLQAAFDFAGANNYNVFEIDELDAYFDFEYIFTNGEGYSSIALTPPSNCHIKMTNNTHLRWQPNAFPKCTFLMVWKKENVTISGGNFYGDRYTHDYVIIADGDGIDRSTHENCITMGVNGSTNVLIDNVNFTDATGDALVIGSTEHRIFPETGEINPDTLYNQNITISNSTLTKSRRNNISITDGEDIYVTNCTISDAGNGTDIFYENGDIQYSSAGVAPKAGIDIEPFRGWNANEPDDGFVTLFDFEKVERVTIDNCDFTDNFVSSLLNYAGIGVIVQNCRADHSFSGVYDFGTKYYNNTIIAAIDKREASGITFGYVLKNTGEGDYQYQRDSEAIGNTIEGFNYGITVRGANPIVNDNTITDYNLAIGMSLASNVSCDNNTMSSARSTSSKGLSLNNLNIDSVSFTNNSIIAPRYPVELLTFNQGTLNTIIFDTCTFESTEGYSLRFENSDNITIQNSTLTNTTISQTNCLNLIELSNTIQ